MLSQDGRSFADRNPISPAGPAGTPQQPRVDLTPASLRAERAPGLRLPAAATGIADRPPNSASAAADADQTPNPTRGDAPKPQPGEALRDRRVGGGIWVARDREVGEDCEDRHRGERHHVSEREASPRWQRQLLQPLPRAERRALSWRHWSRQRRGLRHSLCPRPRGHATHLRAVSDATRRQGLCVLNVECACLRKSRESLLAANVFHGKWKLEVEESISPVWFA
jgi:hypothetical protein